MSPETRQKIEQSLSQNKVFLFMKGSPDFPQCGFSAAAVACLQDLGVPFGAFDVLSDMEVREGIKEYANWPTIPQLYVAGEFVGGADIVRQLHATGELKQMVDRALAS